MELRLPLGCTAIEFSATKGEQIRVAAILGDQQVDKYLTADLSKHPNRKDKWIEPAVAIASQAFIANHDIDSIPAKPDTRNVWERAASAEAAVSILQVGVEGLNGELNYFKKRYNEVSDQLTAAANEWNIAAAERRALNECINELRNSLHNAEQMPPLQSIYLSLRRIMVASKRKLFEVLHRFSGLVGSRT